MHHRLKPADLKRSEQAAKREDRSGALFPLARTGPKPHVLESFMAVSDVQRALWAAVGKGNTAAVSEFVRAGADPNLPIASPGGDTPLIRAISAGDVAMVRALLTAGANVNLASGQARAWTPLMFAHDKPEILSVLISAGADLQGRSAADTFKTPSGRWMKRPGGETVLHLAAAAGNAEVLRVLLAAGASVEAKAENGLAPLDYVLRLGTCNEAAEVLVEAGAQLTPERLAKMHSAAHRQDSDLMTFPFAEPAPASTLEPHTIPASPTIVPALQTKTPSGELRCPTCHALIYSRKSKLCGQCGARLPDQMVLSELEAQAIADQRAWARELAARMDPAHASAPGSRSRPIEKGGAPGGDSFKVQTLLRSVSCVSEFKHRERPTFWLYVSGYAALLGPLTLIFWKVGSVPAAGFLFMGTSFAILCARAWVVASPVCPNCQQNIRTCVAQYCHVCGQPLTGGRCETCGVDESWIAHLNPYAKSGNYSWMRFCPNCAARIDSMIPRWSRRGLA